MPPGDGAPWHRPLQLGLLLLLQRGGTSPLLKSQRRRTALRERRGPLTNLNKIRGIGIPFQRIGSCRRRPILRPPP